MKVLIVGAHPDDETFGMGGTLARHVDAGDEVRVVAIADGVTARKGEVGKQCAAFIKAMALYGVKDFYSLAYLDQQLDAMPLLKIVQYLEDVLRSFPAQVVYTHSRADVGQDHRRVAEAVMVACRPLAGSSVKRLLSFPVPSSTFWGDGSFHVNWYVDVTDHAWMKRKVLNDAYPHELKTAPNPRSWTAIEERARWLAQLAGIDGQAEEFELIRSVE